MCQAAAAYSLNCRQGVNGDTQVATKRTGNQQRGSWHAIHADVTKKDGPKMDSITMGYVVKYNQQELARIRGQLGWRTLFNGAR